MTSTLTPRTQYLELPGGTIAFDDTNGAGTPVVLIPGMLDTRATYRHLHPLLTAAGHRVITMDLRGLGESSVAWDDYSPAAIATDVIALLQHLGVERAVLAGSSYTGATVVKVATTAPDLVAGIVLLDAFIENPQPNALVKLLVKAVGEAIVYVPSIWGLYLNKMAFPSGGPADRAAHTAALVADLRAPGHRVATRGYVRGDSAPVGWTAGVRCPALVVMGDKDPDFTDPKALAERQAAALNGRVVMIEGAGHYPMAEFPQATADALLPFLAEVV
ncbi:alpha/beta hydrolase [Kitasatospora nipponensis]|uniref:Alpha/beta hydrolase n=1 Tax=Kitasatospora nipponensis TaxID=258049 RepID=A0ABP4HH35_9ACTN